MIERQSRTLVPDTTEHKFPKDLNKNSALSPKQVSRVDEDTNSNHQVDTKLKNDGKRDQNTPQTKLKDNLDSFLKEYVDQKSIKSKSIEIFM